VCVESVSRDTLTGDPPSIDQMRSIAKGVSPGQTGVPAWIGGLMSWIKFAKPLYDGKGITLDLK
jgi:hypothetical protein